MSTLSEHTVFQAVARHASFTRAARELGISRSYASRVVARLEERLGARLFVRTTRQVSLTGSGQRLLHATAEVLETLENAEAEVQNSAQKLAGTIRLALPLEYGERVVVPAVLQFQALHPRVKLQLDLSNSKVDLLDGVYDLAIRGGILADSTLHARRLTDFSLRTVASAAYIQRRGRPTHPEALSRHDCLTYTLNSPPNRWVFTSHSGQTTSVTVSGPLRSNSPMALIQATIAGHGVSRHPDFLVDHHIQSGQLVDLLADHDRTVQAFFAVVPSRSWMPARIRALLDFLATNLGPRPRKSG